VRQGGIHLLLGGACQSRERSILACLPITGRKSVTLRVPEYQRKMVASAYYVSSAASACPAGQQKKTIPLGRPSKNFESQVPPPPTPGPLTFDSEGGTKPHGPCPDFRVVSRPSESNPPPPSPGPGPCHNRKTKPPDAAATLIISQHNVGAVLLCFIRSDATPKVYHSLKVPRVPQEGEADEVAHVPIKFPIKTYVLMGQSKAPSRPRS